MKYTGLGKTGLHVSEIGFGAWAIGAVSPASGTFDDCVGGYRYAAAAL